MLRRADDGVRHGLPRFPSGEGVAAATGSRVRRSDGLSEGVSSVGSERAIERFTIVRTISLKSFRLGSRFRRSALTIDGSDGAWRGGSPLAQRRSSPR